MWSYNSHTPLGEYEEDRRKNTLVSSHQVKPTPTSFHFKDKEKLHSHKAHAQIFIVDLNLIARHWMELKYQKKVDFKMWHIYMGYC